MTRLKFFLEGIKHLKTTGTITRSSKFICKEMIKHVDFENSDCIVELGAGDGVITHYILNAMQPHTQLIAFEVLDKFIDILNEIEDPRLHVAADSAENLETHLSKINFKQTDYIISALPFVSLPDDLGERILKISYDFLKPGGKFIQLNYSLIKKKTYKKIFGNVDVNFEPLNIPPAFILVCEKR